MKTQNTINRLEKDAQAHLIKYMIGNLASVEAERTAQQKRVLTTHRNRFSYLNKLAIDKSLGG